MYRFSKDPTQLLFEGGGSSEIKFEKRKKKILFKLIFVKTFI
jgi:hypothetical protein